MIITDYDIQRRKNQRIQEMHDAIGRGTIPKYISAIGYKTKYFFACNVAADKDGVCGVEATIIDMRGTADPDDDLFYVDLAIASQLPGFYVEYLNIPVTSVEVVDQAGNKTTNLCHYPDIAVVVEAVNGKFVPTESANLKLVVDNTAHKGG